MNDRLAAIGAAMAPDVYGMIVLNGFGRHRSSDLLVPSNPALAYLPPCNPELNPIERIALSPKSNRFANRVFSDVACLKEARRTAQQWLIDQSNDIAETTLHGWAVVMIATQHRKQTWNLPSGPSRKGQSRVYH